MLGRITSRLGIDGQQVSGRGACPHVARRPFLGSGGHQRRRTKAPDRQRRDPHHPFGGNGPARLCRSRQLIHKIFDHIERQQSVNVLVSIAISGYTNFSVLGALIHKFTTDIFSGFADYISILMEKGILKKGDPAEYIADLSALVTQGLVVRLIIHCALFTSFRTVYSCYNRSLARHSFSPVGVRMVKRNFRRRGVRDR